ncbi:MAG: pyridoxamine 5'-phosphate oxidase family protein [bacterium]|nr:MAG: pyridoxamine 5'-phosphate oxidase family protein [bacterium]
MDRRELMRIFNSTSRFGTLSTSDGQGNLNAGVFNSPQMVDENTVVMALGDNRTLANLKKHPRAVFLFFEPGSDPYTWKGARVYLQALRIEGQGTLYDSMVEQVRAMAGDDAAGGIRAAVTFRIQDARPIIDSGQ